MKWTLNTKNQKKKELPVKIRESHNFEDPWIQLQEANAAGREGYTKKFRHLRLSSKN